METREAGNGASHEWVRVMEASRPGRFSMAAGILLLVASVSLNVVLARKVRSFARAQGIKGSERQIRIGATVPPIRAKRLDGQQEVISYEGTNQPTIVYVFTPSCAWCGRNMDNFRTLLEKERGHYRFLGLSLNEQTLAEYVVKNNLQLPVYSGLSPETLKAYKLGSTPQTIVVSPEGKVLQNWAGAYVGDQKSQIEGFFHVSLPGLREISKAEGTKQNEVQPQAVN